MLFPSFREIDCYNRGADNVIVMNKIIPSIPCVFHVSIKDPDREFCFYCHGNKETTRLYCC